MLEIIKVSKGSNTKGDHIVSMTKLFDISPPISKDTPVWPGDIPFKFESNWKLEGDCPVNVGYIKSSTHTGAHADAPWHYSNDGKTIDEVDLERYIGPCLVVEAFSSHGVIKIEDIIDQMPQTLNRVLFKTYQKAPLNIWDEEFTAISPEVIDMLSVKGCFLVGIDTPSIDLQNSKTLDAHKAVLKNDMSILEGLVLDGVRAGFYELIAPPLRIVGGDASPVRAILREIE